MRVFFIIIFILDCFLLQAQNEPVTVADSLPMYEGGSAAMYKHIASNVNYPPAAREAGAQGKVFVSFVIDTNGHVGYTKVFRSSGTEVLDKDAVRVVNTLSFYKPAILNGRKIDYPMTLPISFKCSGPESAENVYLNKANKFFDEAKYYDALENFRIYTKHFPKDHEAVTKLGYCYIKTRQSEKGCALLHKIQKDGSNLGDNYIKQHCAN